MSRMMDVIRRVACRFLGLVTREAARMEVGAAEHRAKVWRNRYDEMLRSRVSVTLEPPLRDVVHVRANITDIRSRADWDSLLRLIIQDLEHQVGWERLQ